MVMRQIITLPGKEKLIVLAAIFYSEGKAGI